MNQQDSTLVRIGRDLKFKLERLGLQWQRLGSEGRQDVPYNPDRENLSIDAIIRELLKRDESHRDRSRKNSRPRFAADGRIDPGA